MTSPATGAPGVGSITDVAGVRVGHAERTGRGWQTGSTVVFVPAGATPGVDVRGGGPGTRETDAIAQENLVQEIHAVMLTGGSAFGLAAADGVMSELEARGLGVAVGVESDGAAHQVVPVVPAAVIFDLGRGGDPGKRPDAAMGARALRAATGTQARWGAVGAGTGARAGGLQGGVGTASTTVAFDGVDVAVGAVAVVNSVGSSTDPSTGRPWLDLPGRSKRPTADERRALLALRTSASSPLNTTIGVVATSARCTKSEATKLAGAGHDGLARAIRPAHTMFDGDTVFAMAVGDHDLDTLHLQGQPVQRVVALNALLGAAADVFGLACTHAVLAARSVGTAPGYFDVCRSVDPSS